MKMEEHFVADEDSISVQLSSVQTQRWSVGMYIRVCVSNGIYKSVLLKVSIKIGEDVNNGDGSTEVTRNYLDLNRTKILSRYRKKELIFFHLKIEQSRFLFFSALRLCSIRHKYGQIHRSTESSRAILSFYSHSLCVTNPLVDRCSSFQMCKVKNDSKKKNIRSNLSRRSMRFAEIIRCVSAFRIFNSEKKQGAKSLQIPNEAAPIL